MSQSRVFISVNMMRSDLYYVGAGHGRVGQVRQDMIVDEALCACVGTHMGYA